jgi:hypothetical protein
MMVVWWWACGGGRVGGGIVPGARTRTSSRAGDIERLHRYRSVGRRCVGADLIAPHRLATASSAHPGPPPCLRHLRSLPLLRSLPNLRSCCLELCRIQRGGQQPWGDVTATAAATTPAAAY